MTDPITLIEPEGVEIPEHIEHRIRAPDGRTIAVAEWGEPAGLPFIVFHGTPGGRIGWWEDPTIGFDRRRVSNGPHRQETPGHHARVGRQNG